MGLLFVPLLLYVTHVPLTAIGDILTRHFPNYTISVLHVNCPSSFPMFQELAPHDLHDKCGHHYAICLDLNNQHFEVLDSMRSEADAVLTTHVEYFINTSKRHGTITTKTQRSRSDIFQLSTWQLRSKETGIFPSFLHVSSKPMLTLFCHL